MSLARAAANHYTARLAWWPHAAFAEQLACRLARYASQGCWQRTIEMNLTKQIKGNAARTTGRMSTAPRTDRIGKWRRLATGVVTALMLASADLDRAAQKPAAEQPIWSGA